MDLRQEDGDEFGEIEIALIAVLEEYVPDEFVIGGHVVVSYFIRTFRPTR